MTTSPFSARELVGLLADHDRRAVFAALVLGAADPDSVVHADTAAPRRYLDDADRDEDEDV